MRVITFRAEYEGKVYPVTSIDFGSPFGPQVGMLMDSGNVVVVHIDNVHLMQFTGLLDGSCSWVTRCNKYMNTGHCEHGKEIYEGDIIEYKSNRKELSPVFFNEGSFKLTQPSSKTTRTLGHHLNKYQCEVIGNIYESPELTSSKTNT